MVYIDAAHSYEKVVEDIKAWMPKVAKDGIFAGDDLQMPAVRAAVEDTIKNYSIIENSWVANEFPLHKNISFL